MRDGVRITVDDRADQTVLDLPEKFFGRVELLFRDGELVSTQQTATRTKAELKTAKDAKNAKWSGAEGERTAKDAKSAKGGGWERSDERCQM